MNKKINIAYWIVTVLFSAFMLLSSIPDILNTADAVKFMSGLGYPAYLTPFLGVAKTLGVIAILIPGYPRIKEWAYAGLAFDLIGAFYSVFAVNPDPKGLFMLVFIGLAFASYFLYHKKIKSA
jgi:hypothetical protein